MSGALERPRDTRTVQSLLVKEDRMKKLLVSACVAALLATPAFASLPVGAKAPDFSAAASMGGKQFKFALADALKKGPVVLYFYPAAFTPGCTIEAHNFADAMDDFEKLGATVIGVSHDNIATLDKFSLTECRSKFPVAADTNGSVMKSYDAVSSGNPEYAQRTSYVIAPDGRVLYTYTAGDPTHHVEYTMAAVQKYASEHKR
jgi:peroxiredoxin Q/BCP